MLTLWLVLAPHHTGRGPEDASEEEEGEYSQDRVGTEEKEQEVRQQRGQASSAMWRASGCSFSFSPSRISLICCPFSLYTLLIAVVSCIR